jgi:hypothetical protein
MIASSISILQSSHGNLAGKSGVRSPGWVKTETGESFNWPSRRVADTRTD